MTRSELEIRFPKLLEIKAATFSPFYELLLDLMVLVYEKGYVDGKEMEKRLMRIKLGLGVDND